MRGLRSALSCAGRSRQAGSVASAGGEQARPRRLLHGGGRRGQQAARAATASTGAEAEAERPRIPHRASYTPEDCVARRRWVEQFSGASLSETGEFWRNPELSPELLRGNIETPIGVAKIPLAVAGPLLFKGTDVQGSRLLPMATTEGALVASVTRGAALLSEAGGVVTHAGQQQMTRAPCFVTRTHREAHELGQWVEKQRDRLQEEVVCKVSSVAKLKRIMPIYDHKVVHTLFCYETGDAAGQNATTSCTWHALGWLMERVAEEAGVHVEVAWVENHVSGDKKACQFNTVLGRGMSVSASCDIPESAVNHVMNTTSTEYLEWFRWHYRIASRIGVAGMHCNVSNVLAACFAATGQDVACVAESSTAILSCEPAPNGDGLRAYMHFPSLIVGTVGGGTKLPTQAECLDIMGCRGAGKVRSFAEIVAGYCMALDLSTSMAVVAGEFATAHDRLGRNRPGQDGTSSGSSSGSSGSQ